jgi:hypothetical protein
MHQITKTLFCHKTLHVSGIFFACHQELSTVHTAIGTFHAVYVTASKQSQDGTFEENKMILKNCKLFFNQ